MLLNRSKVCKTVFQPSLMFKKHHTFYFKVSLSLYNSNSLLPLFDLISVSIFNTYIEVIFNAKIIPEKRDVYLT